jgi:hypothetical protein
MALFFQHLQKIGLKIQMPKTTHWSTLIIFFVGWRYLEIERYSKKARIQKVPKFVSALFLCSTHIGKQLKVKTNSALIKNKRLSFSKRV